MFQTSKAIFTLKRLRIEQFIRFHNSHPNLVSFLWYLTIAAVMVYPIFQGKTNIFIDQLLHIPPMYSWWRDQILSGVLPLWNPQVLLGLPFASDPAHPAFSPFNLFFLLFSNPYQASNFLLLTLITFTGLGARKLSLEFGLNQVNAFIVGLFFLLSGSVLESAQDLNSLIAISLTPWMLWAFAKDLRDSNTLLMTRTCLVLWLSLTSGHSQYVYYNLIVGGGLSLFWYWRNRLIIKIIFRWIVSILLVVGLSAYQLLPTFELIQQTDRSSNIGYENIHGTTFTQLPRFIFPVLYGQRNSGNSWGINADIYTGLAGIQGFVSLAAIGLICLSFKNIKQEYRKWAIFWLLVAMTSLIVSLGPQTPIYRLLYEYFPGMSQFRSPSRALVLYSLALSLLAGISIQHAKLRQSKLSNIMRLIGLGGLTLSALGLIFLPTLLSDLILQIKGSDFVGTNAYPLIKIDQISILLWKSGVVAAIGLLAMTSLIKLKVTKGTRFRYQLIITIVGLLVAEAFLGLRGDFIWAPINKITLEPNQVNQLKELNNQNQRFIAFSDVIDYVGIWPYFNHLRVMDHMMPDSPLNRSEYQDWSKLNQHLSVNPANTHLLYGLSSAGGYVAIIPQSYRTYWQSQKVNSLDYSDITDPRINDFGIAYVTTRTEYDSLSNLDQFELVSEFEQVRIYRNTKSKPRVSVIRNNQEIFPTARVTDVNSNHLLIDIPQSPGGSLILRDLYYPGWKAEINGQEIPIAPHNHIFRTIEIPSGNIQVEFKYVPESFYLGLGISLVAWLTYLSYLNKNLPKWYLIFLQPFRSFFSIPKLR